MATQERRPGQPVSRDQISRETEAFLGTLPNSNYSSVSVASFEESSVAGNAGLSAPVTQVTGALLPLNIATTDSSGNRVQFTLLVNPESINHGKTQTVNASLTRKGYVTQVWGPNQDVLTGNGKTAGFMTSEEGLTNYNQQRSIGFKNFMAFFSVYRNNGYQLMDLTAVQGTLTRVINIVHGIELYYDGQIFMGHFNNFTIDEAAETPYIINYNFEFVCSTLNNVYNEVRGHFIPVPAANSSPAATLLSSL